MQAGLPASSSMAPADQFAAEEPMIADVATPVADPDAPPEAKRARREVSAFDVAMRKVMQTVAGSVDVRLQKPICADGEGALVEVFCKDSFSSQCTKLGLEGYAFDLTGGYNMNRPEDVAKCLPVIQERCPCLVVGSFRCTQISTCWKAFGGPRDHDVRTKL